MSVPGGGDAEASVLLVPSASTGSGNTAECLLCHRALGPKSCSELTPFFTPSSRPGPGSQTHSAAPSPQGPPPPSRTFTPDSPPSPCTGMRRDGTWTVTATAQGLTHFLLGSLPLWAGMWNTNGCGVLKPSRDCL